MASIYFDSECTEDENGNRAFWVDRSGSIDNVHGREGFAIYMDSLSLKFGDERDAYRIAVAICERLGVDVVPAAWRKEWECKDDRKTSHCKASV